MQILGAKKLYLPALSIVAAILFLLVLIGISTRRNLDREEKIALQLLHRQGLSVMWSLEAAARAWEMLPVWKQDYLDNLIRETARGKSIVYIYLVDDRGRIVHSAAAAEQGQPAPWVPKLKAGEGVVSRIHKIPGKGSIYEMAKIFLPAAGPGADVQPGGPAVSGGGIRPPGHRETLVVLGMSMAAYEQARHADRQHALIMAAILFILGTGVIFFIFVIQNYYLVNRTLKEARDYTRQVLASMADGLISVDARGQIVSYNQHALQLLGLDESQVRGFDLKRILDFDAAGIAAAIHGGQPVLQREINYRHPSGRVIPLALSATPLQTESRPSGGAVIVLRDLREVKRLEARVKRSEKLAAVGELAAGVAHEIRNPLSSIRGFAQFLRNSLKDRPQEQAYADTMVAEVDRINSVVSDLLTFARPTEARLAPTDITELLEHTLRLAESEARSHRVELHTDISDVSKVPLDGGQMTQALLNLLLNAIQAAGEGGRVELGAAMDVAASRLELWVQDDGPGIAEEQIEKIFEPFYTTREKGTGLGLSIVHKIVENHNGEILVECPPMGSRRGCRFTMRIPIGGDGSQLGIP